MFLIWIQFRPLRTIGLIFALACLPLSAAFAQEKCSTQMSMQADDSLVHARRSWPLLLQHQRKFHSCDDGALADGYSEAVTHLLAQRWDKFETLATIANKNPSFKRWAIRHIDASAAQDNLNAIILNTVTCPSDATIERLCQAIRHAASEALAESEAPGDKAQAPR